MFKILVIAVFGTTNSSSITSNVIEFKTKTEAVIARDSIVKCGGSDYFVKQVILLFKE